MLNRSYIDNQNIIGDKIDKRKNYVPNLCSKEGVTCSYPNK